MFGNRMRTCKHKSGSNLRASDIESEWQSPAMVATLRCFTANGKTSKQNKIVHLYTSGAVPAKTAHEEGKRSSFCGVPWVQRAKHMRTTTCTYEWPGCEKRRAITPWRLLRSALVQQGWKIKKLRTYPVNFSTAIDGPDVLWSFFLPRAMQMRA